MNLPSTVWTRRRFIVRALAVILAATTGIAHAAPPPAFDGNYELAGHRTDRTFSLAITHEGHDTRHVKVSFSAAMADGSGAAPDADGSGKIRDGVLSFKFKDSFANEGTATLSPKPHTDIYQLDMVVTKVAEASPLHFYGTLLLRKVPGHADSP